MSNLESSWEETVVQLAQAGNLRAVAFWLNRHLVAQGICVQASTSQPGQLTLQILCRQAPDRDGLVRFICQRLAELNSPVIRSVLLRTQVMGAAELLWTQNVSFTPVPVAASPVSAPVTIAKGMEVNAKATATVSTKVQSKIPVETPVKTPVETPVKTSLKNSVGDRASSVSIVVGADGATINVVSGGVVSGGVASGGVASGGVASNHSATHAASVALADSDSAVLEKLPSETVSAPATKVILQPTSPKKSAKGKSAKATKSPSLKPQSLKRKTAYWLEQRQDQLQQGGRQLRQSTERSILWFQRQKTGRKALILGGSAIAAFLLGCGFELFRHQMTVMTARSQNPDAAASTAYQGMVKTAIEQVPVIQLTPVNPDSSTITLLFSNAVTLSSSSGRGMGAQQNADMVITSLNEPLEGLPAVSSTEASPTASPIAASPEASGISASPESLAFDSAGANLAGSEQMVGPMPQFSDAQSGGDTIASDPNSPEANSADPSAEPSAELSASEPVDLAAEIPPVDLPPLTLQQLQANGVNVVNLASNPLLRTGDEALTQTIKSLSQANIYPIGAGTDQKSARRPQIFSIKGKRIAYLGYSDVSLKTAGINNGGLNTSVNQQVEADIKSIRGQVDWVIVSYHWNQNLRSYPEDWQVGLTHSAIDHGADLVVGYHPSITQGAEVYGGRAIVYSLGSQLDPYQTSGDGENAQYETFALKLSLQDKQMQVDLLPVRVNNGQTEFLSAEAAAPIEDYLKQASSLFRQPLRSPTTLDAQIRLTLPAAPNSEKPFSEPFTADPPSSNP